METPDDGGIDRCKPGNVTPTTLLLNKIQEETISNDIDFFIDVNARAIDFSACSIGRKEFSCAHPLTVYKMKFEPLCSYLSTPNTWTLLCTFQ
jgi:hypothetical protein